MKVRDATVLIFLIAIFYTVLKLILLAQSFVGSRFEFFLLNNNSTVMIINVKVL